MQVNHIKRQGGVRSLMYVGYEPMSEYINPEKAAAFKTAAIAGAAVFAFTTFILKHSVKDALQDAILSAVVGGLTDYYR